MDQTRVATHKTAAGKYLNLYLVLLAILASTPSRMMAAEEVFLAVLINQQPVDTVIIVRSDGRLFANRKDLRRWRLRLPNATPLTFAGKDYYALNKLEGLSYKLDKSTQTLAIQAPPDLFDATLLKGTVNRFSSPNPASLGGFLNYEVYAEHAQGQTKTSGLFELGGFGSWGSVQTHILAKDFGDQSTATRLNTTWTNDQPMKLASLRFGDAITSKSNWGGLVRFGGVQWATNFATQPGFITFPLPGISGEAALPSAVDLYVDNVLRMNRKVPSGPFSIQDLPVRTGQGESRLIVRDILGREQVIIQPFYTTPLLLKQGLQDYSYELGFVRKDFGIDSNNYGRPLAVGTHRLGITDQFTGEIHGELLDNQQALGFGGVLLKPSIGVLSGSVAASNSDKGSGRLLKFGFQRQSDYFSFSANTELASNNFTKLGQQQEALAPRQLSQAFVSIATSNQSSFGVGYTQRTYRDRENNKLLSGSYSKKIGNLGLLNISILRILSGDRKTTFNMSFSIPLGKKVNASINTSAQQGQEEGLLQIQRSLPAGTGFGYRLVTGVGDSDNRQAEFRMQNEIGTYNLRTAQSQGQTAFSGSASGGMAFHGNDAFLSRRINNSFAVVQVPNYSGVRIYVDNQLIARTNPKGNALLPQLRPYQKNQVRIEQADLPLDTEIDKVQLDAVPYFRSGLLLKFTVKRSRGALITVLLENDQPLPSGALVQIIKNGVEEKEVFFAGLRGQIYLTGLTARNLLRITWQDQNCEFVLSFPESTDPLPHLGTYICTGVNP